MSQVEVLIEILELLKKQTEGCMDKPADVKELMQIFDCCRETIMPYMKRKGSPAFKVGTGRNAKWMAIPREMMLFMKSVSDELKS